MKAVAMIMPKKYFFDTDGTPLAFGKVYTYEARTNNPKPTYQSEDAVVENTNPVILNGEGYANIYLDGSYKIVVKDANDNEIWTADPVTAAQAEEWVECLTTTYLSPASFKVPGDFTATYTVGRKVRIDNNVANYSFSTIVSASFALNETTITVADAVVTTGIIGVCRSIVSSDAIPATTQNDERYGVEFATVAAMVASNPVSIDGVAVNITEGMRISTQGRLSAGDRGYGVYLVMTSAAAASAGVNVDERGEAFTLGNGLIAVLQWSDRVMCTQFGIFPDGLTEWQDNGFNTTFLTFLRDNDVTGVFVAGFYKSKLDNFYSNVSIYCEPGAFWGGTVHAAINSNAADPNTGRAQNVVWKGQIGTYERVGSYNCDNVEIESILVKEDVSKNPSGLRGAGVHLYNSSKNMEIGTIVVEASERSYGLGIDSDNAELPESIHIGSVHIKKSYTHGAAFVCKNTRIDQLVIDDYAVGLLTDGNLTNTVPGSTVPLTDLHGFIVDGGEYPSFGEVIVRQSNADTDAGYGSWLNSSTLKIDRLVSRDAIGTGIGVLNTSVGIANIDELDVRSCSGEGILNQGNMTLGKVTSTQNGGRGFQQSGGSLTADQITCSSNNGEGFRAASAANLNIGSILGSLNNVTTATHQVFLDGVRGHVGVIQTARSATGEGGGVDFNGDLDGFNVGSVDCNNESKLSGNIAAIIMNSVTGLHIDSMNLDADNGANAWQPLRMLTVTDVSINSAIIENQFNGFGVAASTYTRLGFMNCNNKTGVTNIVLASGAAEFNSVNMAT